MQIKKHLFTILILVVAFTSCSQSTEEITLINSDSFETTIDGKPVKLYTLENNNGLVTQITNLGGRVVSLWVPDKMGNYEDIVLGFDTPQAYLDANEKYFGALIGRYGNRIKEGHFELNNQSFTLATNNGKNHLHGGIKGFNDVVWNARQIDHQTLELAHLSKNMEEGYPGTLEVRVVYHLTDKNELKIEYFAQTNKQTVVNLTHHSFFNLHGAGNGTINDHLLQINADFYTPVDDGLIPTGDIASVKTTPMDFRQAKKIGQRVDQDLEQLTFGKGYDHNWVLNPSSEKLTLAARVKEPTSGRIMEVFTNEPGLQFYGGNFLNGKDVGKNGKPYKFRTAFCLETQHFPDSPNHNHFPSTILNPGEEYYSLCIYRFSVE